MKGPTKHHTIPSIFPSKVFKTSVCMHVDSMFCMQAIKKTDHEIDGVLYIVYNYTSIHRNGHNTEHSSMHVTRVKCYSYMYINALQRKNKYMTFDFFDYFETEIT